MVVSIYQYQPDYQWDVVNFRVALYFDSFADESLPVPLPVPAEWVVFYIDKASGGSDFNSHQIQVEVSSSPPGYSQGRGLEQSTPLSSTPEEREHLGLEALEFAVELFFEPADIARDLIGWAQSRDPQQGFDYDHCEWGESQAQAWWDRNGADFGFQNPVRQYAMNSFRWHQQPDVNPSEYYGIEVSARVGLYNPNLLGVDHIDLAPVYLRVQHYSSGGGGGGGCPILSVYNGTGYVEEGLLDIHNPDGIDQITSHVLIHTPEPTEHRYLLRLTEHPQTYSHLDQVQLFAILTNGTEVKLPLVSVIHSEYGNVKQELLVSDDVRAVMLGENWNNGTSQYIDLKFAAPDELEIQQFTFIIEGYNRPLKIP